MTFRGILANQYATYYTGAILGLLIQAGYTDNPRVEMGLRSGCWTCARMTAAGAYR